MRSQQLTRTATITLDGSGNGTAQLGPSITNEQWLPQQVSVSCSAAVTSGTCQAVIYAGAPPGVFVDGTFSGDTGDTSSAIAGQILWPGQYVTVVWITGVPGAQATVTVQGSRQVP